MLNVLSSVDVVFSTLCDSVRRCSCMQFGKGVECWEKLRLSMLVVTERVLAGSVCGQCVAFLVQTGVNAPTARQVIPCSFSLQDYDL